MDDISLGQPLAQGQTAVIYPWEEGYILKCFHPWFSLEAIQYEAHIAHAVHVSGLPVPAVGDIIQVNQHNCLIYERIDGPNMFTQLQQKPWRLFYYAHRLAQLHSQLHTSPIQPELPAQRQRLQQKIKTAAGLTEEEKTAVLTTLQTLPDSHHICHGDLHPGNILLTTNSEVIIDWIDATSGNPLADVARTSILLLGAIATNQIPNPLTKISLRLFHQAYLRHYFTLHPSNQPQYQQWLPIIAAARLNENIPELKEWLQIQVKHTTTHS